MIDASARTNEESGDGTTTCTVIARAILNHGQALLHSFQQSSLSQANMNEVRRGMQMAIGQLKDHLDEMAIIIKSSDGTQEEDIKCSQEVRNIAMVASN